jgi:uncharacterized protein (DUF1501 family)
MITRRKLLKGLLLAGGFTLLPLSGRGWVLAAPEPVNRHLVVIMMRGAVDGLNVVTPYREANYYRVRNSIAMPPPGQSSGLVDLDGYFGLNPALTPIMPLWQDKTLAFIHACGSPNTTRSHFEAQDILETAMMNTAMASQGWMNGLAQALPVNQSATRAVAFGNVLPKIFQGHYDVSTIPVGIKGNGGKQVSNPQLEQAFSQLYGNQTELGGLYKQGLAARSSVMQDLQNGPDLEKEMEAASKGAPGADGFAIETSKVAQMIRQDPGVQLVFLDVGGWDTHVQQGSIKGQLFNKLNKLGEGIAALAQGLGPAYKDTAILIMSEFGRTVAENGNAGTDHGHGNVAWLMGGGVKGGKVWHRWPGLNENQLYEGRDLAVTTDFRGVIGSVASGHFGLDDQKIAAIIPGYQRDVGLSPIIT